MRRKLPDELLFDSETNLRLADRMMTELTDDSDADHEPRLAQEMLADGLAGTPMRPDLPEILLSAYREITGILNGLRRSRDILERATLERLRRTNERLREVSAATETAATDMLNGLDRVLAMVDGMEQVEESGGVATSNSLRNEIHGIIGCLQFQDIASQQLSYASTVMEDLELRLAHVAELLNATAPTDGAEESEDSGEAAILFDPAATTREAVARQALADRIFRSKLAERA